MTPTIPGPTYSLCQVMCALAALSFVRTGSARYLDLQRSVPPPNISYVLTQEIREPRGQRRVYRIWYDRGKFRQEENDSRTCHILQLTVYDRDGQWIAFEYGRMSPPRAGVDLDGMLYRVKRDFPEYYRSVFPDRMHGRISLRGPEPYLPLSPFGGASDVGPYEPAGNSTVAGLRCRVYRITGSGPMKGRTVHVWNGYVLQTALPDGLATMRVKELKFGVKIDPSKFELLPGTEVKVPSQLHIRLPANVKRVEYAGYGIVKGGGGTRVLSGHPGPPAGTGQPAQPRK